MEEEKEQLKKYGVYEELDQLPHGKQTVNTKWVLREKFDQAGKLQKRKARLTARGFTQVYSLHNDDTYAPVAQPDSWRSLLVLALRDRWIILQADVVAAYLNAPLKHEIYISDPSVTKDKVWCLHKALYGLKQSAFEWNTTMTMLFGRSSLLPMKSDPACYVGDHIRVATHVDDYLIVARGVEDLVEFTQVFEQNVEIDHRGKPSSFLNIECHWETIPTSPSDSTLQTALRLTQIRAIEALCAEYGITYGVSSPMSLNDDLTAPRREKKSSIPSLTNASSVASATSLTQPGRTSFMQSPTSLAVIPRPPPGIGKRHSRLSVSSLAQRTTDSSYLPPLPVVALLFGWMLATGEMRMVAVRWGCSPALAMPLLVGPLNGGRWLLSLLRKRSILLSPPGPSMLLG